MLTIKALLDRRTMLFRAKVMNAKTGSLMQKIVKINYENELGWESRCRCIMEDYGLKDCAGLGPMGLESWKSMCKEPSGELTGRDAWAGCKRKHERPHHYSEI
ncbi:unnamed protein product [Blepharisma stoltei]|uniref:Uncharacterized protein n=1 Tax=Blepharisma stoltei TaxID=1481888 RepID=A0AAU9ISY6_9CILI|nr:unnamed protein product [Blepharisma stoltei]